MWFEDMWCLPSLLAFFQQKVDGDLKGLNEALWGTVADGDKAQRNPGVLSAFWMSWVGEAPRSKEDCCCTGVLVDTQKMLWCPWSGWGALCTTNSRFLGVRKCISATSLFGENMPGLEQDQPFSCRHCQHRTNHAGFHCASRQVYWHLLVLW